LSQAGTSPLAGSKWAWLRKYPDGRSAEAISFRALNQLNLKTSRAWCIKEIGDSQRAVRVVCNLREYPLDWHSSVFENPAFDPGLLVEIGI
jgi:hypothetical protein